MQDEDLEIKINPKKLGVITKFFIKYKHFFLVLIPILITIFVRAQSINLTVTDDWGRTNVYNYYRNQIQSQINKQYPNLPESNLESLVEQNFINILKTNKDIVEQQIKENSAYLKGYFQYQSGTHYYPYMGDIDSYFYLRQARNIIEKGVICDIIEDNVCYDTYTLAPQKEPLPQTLHPYSIVYLYKIIKPFNRDLTLMQAQILVPTVFAVIVAVLIFLMMLKAFGPLAAVTSSVFISVNPTLLTRTLGSDTDVYNVLFPILIVFFAFESFSIKDLKKKMIFASIAGIAIGAYSFAWSGWWYLFDFIVIAVILDFVFKLLRDLYKKREVSIKKIIKNQKTIEAAAIIIPFLVFSLVSVSIAIGIASFPTVYEGPFSFMRTKAAANPTMWPNVLTTVAEFNEASIPQIISHMGGKFWFFLALLGLIFSLYNKIEAVLKNIVIFFISVAILYYMATPTGSSSLRPVTYVLLLGLPFILGLFPKLKSEEETDIKTMVMFFVWIAASIYAATKGVRFTLLLVPPVAVGIGISFGFLHSSLTKLAAGTIKINKAIISLVIFIALLYFLITPVKAAVSTAKGYIPNVDDQWWSALTQIKDNSKPDAIINSWWDFGHWFKYIADRRVTLDGSSQNNPQLHWLGKTLLTSDEKEARGILRMLDCGGNQAFDAINKIKKDTPKSVHLLNQMLVLEKEEAKELLIKESFSEEQSQEILQYTHCNPPEDFFVTSEDMVGKSGVWAHFGSWDFDRAWMHKTFDELNSEETVIGNFIKQFNFSRNEAYNYYAELKNLEGDAEVNSWIAPWPGYVQGEADCENISNIVKCSLQQLTIEIDLTTMDAAINTPEGIKRLDVVSYTTPKGIETKVYSENTINVGMLFMITKDGYKSIFMSPALVNSTFTRLFYLEGHGTKYFDLFHDSNGLNGFRIKIWKLNWQGRDNPIIIERFNVINPYRIA